MIFLKKGLKIKSFVTLFMGDRLKKFVYGVSIRVMWSQTCERCAVLC